MNNKNAETNESKKNLNKKSLFIKAVIGIVIIILLLLSIYSCALKPVEVDDTVIGDFSISQDKQGEVTVDNNEKEEIPTITFSGYGKRTVSEERPNIELRNPEGNFVDMVFTVTDRASGEIIARTDKVPAGNYVYVNVMNFYKESGVYNVDINISTTDSQTGEAMNGLNQEVELTVE